MKLPLVAKSAAGVIVPCAVVVVGSDHPIPWEEHPVEVVIQTTTLSAADRVAILGGNAEALFPRLKG